MKTIKYTIVLVLSIFFCTLNAQEKKIKFNKGTLKICSSKNFQIEGYDGEEVIIKSLHEKRENKLNYFINSNKNQATTINSTNGNLVVKGYANLAKTKQDSVNSRQLVFFNNDIDRKKGLKKLGDKNKNNDLGIYFEIEQKGDELFFRDKKNVTFIMASNERYLIKIPNTLKLNWQTNKCENKENSNKNYRFFSSKESSLSNFDGEVEISSTLNNTRLTDVTGPVSINTIGGNVTIEFDKKTPRKLYSIYTNNGFIDIQIPNKSNLLVDVIGKSVFSDVNFKVLEEEEVDDIWQTTNKMKLKSGSGSVKMKLNAGFGNVYLRKK